ncbi:hypothetical protein [Intrasporangium sp. YIM S08009]|uniref:hypothetical protein n=1 Tax=Intrasporangium zincisolvens TaxID=3080018 RepID=UPI002B05708B|nr:hypothetical protein [Intrasporangium sp. YIM S08009]
MTAIPVPRTGAPVGVHAGLHTSDTPSDHRPFVGRPDPGVRTHRFPAATYLCREVARDERAFALAELAASGRRTSRRVGALCVVVGAAFVAMLVLLSTGRASDTLGVALLVGIGAVMVIAIVGLVAVLRRHEREYDRLADRVRRYEARLLELRAARSSTRR